MGVRQAVGTLRASVPAQLVKSRPVRLLRRVRCFYLLSALSASIIPLYSHPISISYSQFEIEGDTVTATLRLPMEELDLLMQLDEDLDGNVSPQEIERSRDVIETYFWSASWNCLPMASASLRRLGNCKLGTTLTGFCFWKFPWPIMQPAPSRRSPFRWIC